MVERGRLSSCLHFFRPSPALRQCSSQESYTGPWVYTPCKLFAAPKPIAPFRDEPTAEKSQRSHSGCADLFHKQLLQPIVWLSSTKGYPLGTFSSDSHTLQGRASPHLPGESPGEEQTPFQHCSVQGCSLPLLTCLAHFGSRRTGMNMRDSRNKRCLCAQAGPHLKGRSFGQSRSGILP